MDKSDRPFDMEQLVKNAVFNVNEGAINIGKALKYLKNSGRYKDLDYKTFNQYLSSLKIMPRSARRYITIVEKYIDELKVEEERLYGITPARLEKMIPFIGECSIKKRDEWLARAETCSNKDFIDLVNEERNIPATQQDLSLRNGERACQGKGMVVNLAGGESNLPRLSPKEYMAMVKKADCVLCPGKKNKGIGHHFPQRRNRGKFWQVIPLCAECHIEADGSQGDASFWLKYKGKLMSWFYNLIVDENAK